MVRDGRTRNRSQILTAETLRIHPDEPEPELIAKVVDSLHSGQVVALPTDTFYGLAVDPVNFHAVDRIYEIKSRARHKPLSLLIDEVAQAYELARQLDTAFDRLAEKFWPGPLTIIVKAGSNFLCGSLPIPATSHYAFPRPLFPGPSSLNSDYPLLQRRPISSAFRSALMPTASATSSATRFP